MIRLSLTTLVSTTARHTAALAVAAAKVSIFSETPPPLGTIRPADTTACVVLGNGPSLKESLAHHPDFLAGKDLVCTNDFADTEYFTSLQPRYYVFTDPTYWAPNASDRFQKLFAGYRDKFTQVDWPLFILMPMAARSWNYFQDLSKNNPRIRLLYFNSIEVDCFRRLRFWLYRRNLAAPPLQNVMAAGIFLGLNMGYRSVYLLGGDHSWHESLYVDEHNRLYITNARIQDREQSSGSPFYEDPSESDPYNMYRLFHAFSRMYLGYMELEAYARSIDAKVFNSSKRSYIDAFERFSLEPSQ